MQRGGGSVNVDLSYGENSFINAVRRVNEAREAKAAADQEYARAAEELIKAIQAENSLKTILLVKHLPEDE
jgi:hypothetical protein